MPKNELFFNIKKWSNGKTILLLANSFKKAKWQPCQLASAKLPQPAILNNWANSKEMAGKKSSQIYM